MMRAVGGAGAAILTKEILKKYIEAEFAIFIVCPKLICTPRMVQSHGTLSVQAIHDGGKAVFSIDTLSRLALERCATSRCAVKLMGDLAENHGGFYGAGSFEGTAESLMVIDGTEGFIFQILPDDTGTSAIWVAQRVPDDSVGVVSNMFTIRDVNLTCPPSGCGDATMLGSQNMYTIAEKQGWWKPADGALDFTKVSCCCCCRRCRRRCRCRRCCNSRCCNH